MALLKQSPTWPIHSVRDLHSKAQLNYLWQFDLLDENDSVDRNMAFLAQRVGIPGVVIDRQSYSVGGQENYSLGVSRRGGIVSAVFLEIEGGVVDRFFRTWFDSVDGPDREVSLISRARQPKGFGRADQGYSRVGGVRMLTRQGALSAEWRLYGLLPLSVGRYEFTYEGSGAMLLPVEMVCDEVERTG